MESPTRVVMNFDSLRADIRCSVIHMQRQCRSMSRTLSG